MIPPDDSYEPDSEECAYMLEQDAKFEAFCSTHDAAQRELRDYHKHTDRQLHDLSKERKSIARQLQGEFLYDVAEDSFDVPVYTDDDVDFVTVPCNKVDRENDKDLGPLTRKDKRKMKKRFRELKRLGIWNRIWTKRGCSPRRVKGYEDMSFTPVVAAR
jgi:hypothetical protein